MYIRRDRKMRDGKEVVYASLAHNVVEDSKRGRRAKPVVFANLGNEEDVSLEVATGMVRALERYIHKRWGEKPDPASVGSIASEVKPLSTTLRELSAFEPYRAEDEIADGFITLASKNGGAYDVRAVLVRRKRAGQLTVLATSVTREDMGAASIANGYFDRWPRQELRFKEFVAATSFKAVKGYGKQQVANVAVVTELEKLEARKATYARRIERQKEAVTVAKQEVTRAKLALNAAKARRKRGDGRVECSGWRWCCGSGC